MPQSPFLTLLPSLLEPFRPLQEALQRGHSPLHVSGLGSSSTKALWITLLYQISQKRLLLVTGSMEEAQTLYHDLLFFTPLFDGKTDEIRLFPNGETLPYEKNSPPLELRVTRIRTLHHLLERERFILITVIPALCQRLLPRDLLRKNLRSIRIGESLPPEMLLCTLEGLGYLSVQRVQQVSEYSHRGGIVDLFPPSLEKPVRLEYVGDTLESIRLFDPVTQCSTDPLGEFQLLPARELILTQDLLQNGWETFKKRGHQLGLSPHQIKEQWELPIRKPLPPGSEILSPFLAPLESLFDYTPSDSLVLLDEPTLLEKQSEEFHHEVREAYRAVLQEGFVAPPPEELYLNPEELLQPVKQILRLESIPLTTQEGNGSYPWEFRSIESIGFHPKGAPFTTHTDLLKHLREKYLPLLVCRTPAQLKRLRDLFFEQDLPTLSLSETSASDQQSQTFYRDSENPLHTLAFQTSNLDSAQPFPLLLHLGDLSSGFLAPDHRLLILTEEEFLGHRFKHRPLSQSKAFPFLPSFDELQPQDWVVHLQHGIGRYVGLKRLAIQEVQNEFMVIQYAGDDKLYVPLDHLDQVQRYTGIEGITPRPDRLGGITWSKTQQRVKREVEEMTDKLLELYATRQVTEGFSFSPDNSLTKAFEASFEYEETLDQLRAIRDVKEDMEKNRPMDRLICGDVGYGKTEVALRATFKAVADSKQVALLVPTTLLAHQHLQTFTQRLAPFPIRVEMLSRFRSPQEQKAIIQGLREGQIDVVIGTHRLLQKDVQFQDLGLVIIDEEQRFGVTHKEHHKRLRAKVDVLTLTATPIPRTLHLSLMEVRDISIIETPPADRLAIRTLTGPFDKEIIREGIQRELDRGGQVFFVHNRVQTIERMASILKNLFPHTTLGIAHGQMTERSLEEVMRRFVQKDCQILLCTSIVESGLDIPDANTIFINRADQFGLSELYQLRGRVGRSGQQAFAYLLVPQGRALSTEARKRLQAIQEFTELGAGFRIAARDLEIRGAGSLLGKKQSGHITALGFEFYLQMIENAVRQIKGEVAEEEIDPTLNLKVSAFLSEEYIPDTHQRLSIYKRLSSIRNEGELETMAEELRDRFGPLPPPAQQLLRVMEIKILCKRFRLLRIDSREEGPLFTLDRSHHIPQEGLDTFMTLYHGKIRFHSEYSFQLLIRTDTWDDEYVVIRNCLQALRLTQYNPMQRSIS